MASICAANVRIMDSSAICSPWGFKFTFAAVMAADLSTVPVASTTRKNLIDKKKKPRCDRGFKVGKMLPLMRQPLSLAIS
jgi:hypothetical protein